MVATLGLVGLRPSPEKAEALCSPPYDVIKVGSALEALLRENTASLFHVILGDDPAGALTTLREQGVLIDDEEACYYVYEQRWGSEERTGVFIAAAVSDYAEREIIRHEKTFDAKVTGRIALRTQTEHSFGPVFVLTKARLAPLLAAVKSSEPEYAFTSDFDAHCDLHGIDSRIWRVPESSPEGQAIQAALAPHPLYIADGHHRYHASLRNEQSHFLCYVTEEARIQAYNRVVNGVRPFSEIKDALKLTPLPEFATPPKHSFCLYHQGKAWLLEAETIPDDVVGGLDCAILERELYPLLGLTHDKIVDPAYFDYYPESALEEMKAVVDRGDYDLAIALHPVAIEELMAVADAGLEDSEIVMPEKSTFFAPKVLSGVVVYRHRVGER